MPQLTETAAQIQVHAQTQTCARPLIERMQRGKVSLRRRIVEQRDLVVVFQQQQGKRAGKFTFEQIAQLRIAQIEFRQGCAVHIVFHFIVNHQIQRMHAPRRAA